MNREAEQKSVSRSQKQPKTQRPLSIQMKKNDLSRKESQSGPKEMRSGVCDSEKEMNSVASQGKHQGKVSPPGPAAESPRSPGAHRKLSDASTTSEDLSKDSGCLSAKLSSSDSSSEISDCPSEGNKRDSPSSDNELSWIDGRAYESPDSEGKEKETEAVNNAGAAAAAGVPEPGLFYSPEAFIELMMGETTEDLAREAEDLRSENEYLKDELEELRCEMLEMRDMFQEEEVYQLQQLQLQLDQANKTCRILQYRLRKAERRSIRVAQTGQVDGELVRTLEQDIKVAKSVSLRLYNELEAVQKKNSQLEWENEVLREKTQELEVAKQVLQVEAEKARESSVKKKSIRPATSKAEKRLSQIEDDSSDLRCQLHFAKEELALMCKKLTKLVSESEGMQDELVRYRSAYGDISNTQLPEGKQSSAHVREAEVKIHLKLVEEEAMLLSRRIVELEVENRGLRAEMSHLREKTGAGGSEEEEEEIEPTSLTSTKEQDRGARDQSLDMGFDLQEQGKFEGAKMKDATEIHIVSEGKLSSCHITREGPVGGEWDPSDSHEGHNEKNLDRSLKLLSQKNSETLLALRDHSCILSSAVQLLMMPPKNGHCSSPLCTYASLTERDLKSKAQSSLPGPLNEALELFQAMLLAFIRRVETLLMGEELDRLSLHKEGHVWESCVFTFPSGERTGNVQKSPSKQDCVEDLRTAEVKERAKQTKQAALESDNFHCCRDPKMQQCLHILWVLHQWCQEGKESPNQTMLVLHGLLQDLAAQLQDEQMRFDKESKAMQGKAAECALSSVFHDEQPSVTARMCSPKGRRRQFSLSNPKTKNWCYVSQEAAQLDREDPVKMWDHLIMPLSFPELDFEQMSMERSHTAPEKTVVRIYYSPPSRRRVQLAQLKQSPAADRESVTTASPWCTPPTSFSPLCLGSSSNLSDDMKEMTVRRHALETSGDLSERGVNMACSGTQTHMKPQMVSVALQTDGTQGTVSVKNSPSRVLNSSLMSDRTHRISSPLNGPAGRVERHRPSSTSPKLRRHSSLSSVPSSLSSSSSSLSTRDRALWSVSHQNHTGLTWTRQTSQRVTAGQNYSSVTSSVTSEQLDRSTKSPSKPAGSNKCGLVTEFLRRVSGRAEKPVQRTGHKIKSTLKNVESVPTRPPGAPQQKNDSVTRIVNQRFMKQRDERAYSLNQGVRLNPVSAEDANYDCSSSSTLTFCFARPSRSTQRPTLYQSKVQQRRYTPPNSSCA